MRTLIVLLIIIFILFSLSSQSFAIPICGDTLPQNNQKELASDEFIYLSDIDLQLTVVDSSGVSHQCISPAGDPLIISPIAGGKYTDSKYGGNKTYVVIRRQACGNQVIGNWSGGQIFVIKWE